MVCLKRSRNSINKQPLKRQGLEKIDEPKRGERNIKGEEGITNLLKAFDNLVFP
jgi:hypothetical protein